ncbi:hypothetical protein FQN54_000815 [Arachnomyces sp. PD_36]|nr:hypothetical protein FQN54_000815 [Arachnomyces sp. PD_36]
MATERSLATLLRSLQTGSDQGDAYSLLPSSTSLLSHLTNPLNVTLLSSQLLTSPALWDQSTDLHSCRRILSVFNTAAITILKNEAVDEPRSPYARRQTLKREEWVKAVVNGADANSPRWRHTLLLSGILIGFEGQDRQGLPSSIKTKLESALVKAVVMALNERDPGDKLAGFCLTMVLNHSFELLSDFERAQIDYDLLLPILVEATAFSQEGLEGGYFLGTVDRDVKEVSGKRFKWAAQSPTHVHVRNILSKPLIASLGPLSRLIAHSIENVRDPDLVAGVVGSLTEFARTLMVQWLQNKLSEIDPSEEADFLDEESRTSTVPVLWRLLRTSMFSFVIILRAVLGRVLNDPVLASGRSAPFLAMRILHILRNYSFVSSRMGQTASSQYAFVNLTAIDILSQYPQLAEDFAKSIRPSELGQIPGQPVERCLDLFFLNTVEHFTLVLSPEVNDELLIAAAQPYIASGGNNNLLEIFEAAHSVILAVLAAPNSADMAVKHLPFYVDTLFSVFPQNLSSRQFRLAFKTVLRITAPPSPLANTQPLLPSILLDLLHERALHAPTTPIPPHTSPSQTTPEAPTPEPPLSEQSILTLTIIDCLSFLSVDTLSEWLPLTAKLLHRIQDADMRRACQERMWEALSGGEMDVERASFCVTWWSTLGGRELVLFGEESELQGPFMSGALGEVVGESKL